MKARDASATGFGRPKAVLAAVAICALALALGAGLAGAVAPTVTIEPATPAYTTAQAKGEVNPGDKETSCRFEYATDEQFQVDEWASATQAPCAEGTLTGNALQPVSAELSGLTHSTTYHLRLVAENEDGSEAAVAPDFETETVTEPVITNLAVSNVTADSAHFSAEVDPTGTDPAFETSVSVFCEPTCGSFPAITVPAGGSQPVEVDAANLDPGTEYTVHLVATNAGGKDEATAIFTAGTAEPWIIDFEAGPVQSDSAMLNGEVAPRGSETTWWFEWGAAECAANPCEKTPVQSAGAGPHYKWTQHLLGELEPATTYHFRLVAENAHGTVAGPDHEFTTLAPQPPCPNQGALGTDFLPDCRAWEMVSPPEKHGIGVIPMTSKTHVASDGEAVTFAGLGDFGGAKGSGVDVEYMARRSAEPGTNGWATHPITPPTRTATFLAFQGNSTTYVNGFTPDLGAAVFKTWYPLTGPSNTQTIATLYRVEGLLEGNPAPAELVTGAEAPVADQPFPGPDPSVFAKTVRPFFAGASEDLSHVFFEEKIPLTEDSPGFANPFCRGFAFGCPQLLFEHTDGEVRLVGRVPAGGGTFCDEDAGGSAACESAPSAQTAIPATFPYYSERMISEDGRRIYFQTPADSVSGPLYLREDGERTYKIADSGTAWDASRDGSRLFFTSSEALTAGDSDGGSPDAYMWDREAPAGNRLTLISQRPGGPGCYTESIIGASEDGRSVYFGCSGGQPVAGQPPVFSGIYRWHEGKLAFVGGVPNKAENTFRTSVNLPGTVRRTRVSPDGRHLLFMAVVIHGLQGRGGFEGSPGSGEMERLFRYDAATGRISCASCGGGDGSSAPLVFVHFEFGAADQVPDVAHILSDDGRYTFFSSSEALVPEDTNGTYDAYVYDSRNGEQRLISSGTDESPSYMIDASDSGDQVFFVTRERLSGWDVDGLNDLYVARVNGGVPEPAPVPAPCEGESCRAAADPVPPPPPAGSKAKGTGNPPRKCPKGTRKVRKGGEVRCVKKKRGAKKHNSKQGHGRGAGADRRAGR